MIDFTKFETGDHIPKVIHQVFYSNSDMPIELKDNVKKICDLNPEWEHRIYDDIDMESYILQHYGTEILGLYHRINPSYGAARVDFFRYLLMYAEGGVYLDIKGALTLPLDDIIKPDDSYILSKWDDLVSGRHRELKEFGGVEYQQWHIIAVAGHPFLRKVIEEVIQNIQQFNILKAGIGKISVLRITGPIAYTLAIEKIKSSYSFRELNIKNDFGIEYSIYQRPGKVGNHYNLFKKHYTKSKVPLINPKTFQDYFLMSFYYLVVYGPRKIAKSILSYYRKK